MFLATANVADTIPGPLLDRMEVIRFDGYTNTEKLAIAKGYLWPRQRDRNGLREEEVSISDEVLRHGHHRVHPRGGRAQPRARAGHRAAQDRHAHRLRARWSPRWRSTWRWCATRSGARSSSRSPRSAPPCRVWRPGLAVTGTGGDVLFVEATKMKSSGSGGGGGLVLTGQLGDVMKESARIALSYVRGHAAELGIEESVFEGHEFHVHVPAGRDPQGRPLRGCDDGHRAGLAALRAPGEAHGGDDRRGHPAGPRAADRRPQAEGARGARRWAHRRDHARAQPRRSR